ncbi:MAG: ywbH [Firmicutes bacterium]|nr:ywbH [Bacillota bacterium]
MKNLIKGTLQVAILYGFSFLLNSLLTLLNIKFPSSLLGIFILLILLHTKLVRAEWFEVGANWLMTELLLFFVPAAVGIINYQGILKIAGVKIMLAIFLSTALVMICSGLSTQLIAKFKEKKLQCQQ